ncbi:hypothetical protein VKT23_019827 [Stygiomarasmius scandens]|uniref:Uncharacterized protein n=1 Tax=Marasmiellus scandens TaxID=2682957 RepID=A0ABR1IKD8_9AGAR
MEDYPNLNLTEAMLQKSQHSPEERDIRAVKFTMSSLTDDTDLLPLLEAVPDLIYSPIGLRSANISLVDPLLASSSTQLNIIPRINSFMARSGAWTASQLHTLSMTICPKALWALAYLFLQNQRRIWKQSTNPDNIETFLFDRNVVEVLSTSQFLQKEFACSALAAVRLVRGFGYFFVATKAMRAPFFSDDQGLLKRLEVVLRVWKDIDLPGASGLASLLDSVGDVMEVLRNENVNPDDSVNQSIRNLLEDRAFPILERRWKANQIAILSEFLVNCLETNTYPNQFPLLYNIVFPDGHPSGSSITAFQDDEVDSVYKSIRLIQSTIITTGRYSAITDEVAKCSLRLFFLIPQARSNNQQPIEFRKVIQTYIIARGDSDRVALKDLWEKDQYSCLGNCILHDILHNQFLDTEHVDICIIAMWQLCKTALHTQSRNHIPEIAHKFAKDLFPALRNAHEKIQQHKLYTTIKLFIDWIVLNNVGVFVGHVVDGDHLVFRQDRILRGQVPDDQVMDNIYTLGREMLPDLFSPEFKISRTPFTYARGLPGDKDLSRSLQEMNHMSSTFQPFRSYFMSVNLILVARLVAIIARDSDLDEEHNVRLLERLILDFRFYGSSANEESQVRFADSLLDLAFTFVEKPGANLPSSVLKIIFNKTNTSFSWKWISSRRCAQILLESIQKLEDSGNSVDIGMCQEDFDPILDICWEVIDDSGQIRNIARMAETVSLDSEISTESSEVTEVGSECVKVMDRG